MNAQRFYEVIYYLVTLDINYFNFQSNYLDFIFPHVFLWTVAVSILFTVLYYNVVGNITGRLGFIWYWLLFMGLNGVSAFFLAFGRVANYIYIGLSVGSDGWILGINNFLLSCLLFFFISFACKTRKLSRFADHIPFKTPW